MNYELETLHEIWPDQGSGERIEVGHDRDGLGLVEIRQKEPAGSISSRISMAPEQATLVAKAILLVVQAMDSQDQ